MKKRILSVFMSLCMMLTMVPAAFAVETEQELPPTLEVQQPDEQAAVPGETETPEESELPGDNAGAEGEPAVPGDSVTKDITSEDTLRKALESAQSGETVTVTGDIEKLNTSVTVPAGVTLNFGNYLIKAGTVEVEPGATLAAASDAALNGKSAQEIVGPDTLANTAGNIEVTFADDKTTITIPANTTAEINGPCWNNTGKGDTTYRLPKSDSMVVNGTLTISHETTIAGKLYIAPAAPEAGIATFAAAEGTVIVKRGETLNVGKNYNATGEIIVEAGATLKAGDDELIGPNSLNLTSGTATVKFGTYDGNGTYDTAITLNGNAEAKGSGVWTKDALTVASGTLTVSGSLPVKGQMTVNQGANVVVASGGKLELAYQNGEAGQGALQANGGVTVQNGGTLHVNEYGVTGTIHVDAGATVLVTDADWGDSGTQDEEMIGSGSLNITTGTASVTFTNDGTNIEIPAGCEAEIAGPFMDADAYRLPKSDSMSVAGKLTVQKDPSDSNAFTGMEVTGKLDVTDQGIVAVESGKLELVETKNQQNQGSLSVDKNASVEVKKDATLDVEKGTITSNGKVYMEEGATFTATQDQKETVKPVENATPVTFTFNPNGGAFADGNTNEKVITTLAHPSTKAPTVTKSGYTFTGWSGLNENTTYTQDTTFIAQWRQNDSGSGGGSGTGGGTGGSSGSSSSGESVTVDRTTGGTVQVRPGRAESGETVTIIATPKDGYEVGEVTVTDRNGKEIDVRSAGDNRYTFTMPSTKVDVKVDFVRVGGQQPAAPSFRDVSNSAYYADAVRWAVEQGITTGTTADTFSPNSGCTRAQIVTFLWRANGSPAPSSAENPFTDVNAGAYYADAVLWAVEQGITGGTTATTFSPDSGCTRAQAATFLWRASGSPAAGESGFADVADGAYYADAVNWAVANGVTQGTAAGTFSPNTACTRAQIVTFLYRAMA